MYYRDRLNEFTEQARKALNLAELECQRYQHKAIGTEHLLLGLVSESDGIAAKVLANLGIELNNVRSQIELVIGRGDNSAADSRPLTPRAKKVIELAANEAHCLKRSSIGTEHLLLGLVHEDEGIGIGILESLGVHWQKVRLQTMQVLSQEQ